MNTLDVASIGYKLSVLGGIEAAYAAFKVQGYGGKHQSVEERKEAIKVVAELGVLFDNHGLTECATYSRNCVFQLSKSVVDISTVSASLIHFREQVLEDFKAREFLQIAQDRSEYIDAPELFGGDVSKAFPSAEKDIAEAGNCLATESCTACVFHLMRAVEFALRALAKDRDVSFKDKPLDEKEWGQILGQLETKVSGLRQAARSCWPSGEIRDNQIRFYNEVIQELRSFNDAWRRHLSHADVGAFYDRDQSASIMKHVRSLMEKLSTKISETSFTREYWDSL